mmetsp:Transcript_9276/g.42242  ORF Transcript_9276/g.42242 Transcript_9276/m.42242 type:complete len:185 (-) Transcript_9276:433-987(-)
MLRKLAGRVLVILYRNHIRDAIISKNDRVLQFGVGFSHGAQMCAMAAQEHLRLNPTHAIFSLHLKNAFNCVDREAIAHGINKLEEAKGRAMLGFFPAMYSNTKPPVLFPTRRYVQARERLYWGDSRLRPRIRVLLSRYRADHGGSARGHPVKDVHAYCIADDIYLAAEPEQLIRAAVRLQKGLN